MSGLRGGREEQREEDRKPVAMTKCRTERRKRNEQKVLCEKTRHTLDY